MIYASDGTRVGAHSLWARVLVMDPLGRIVAGGERFEEDAEEDFVVRRLDPGSGEVSFLGRYDGTYNHADFITDLVVLADGSIYALGGTTLNCQWRETRDGPEQECVD
ncbi:MAG: hypothetical protein FJ405_08760, partial [Verrucomicrobia bacterium]|nr:hypothetical protein [Verrucomicrobiota bacterium]